MRHKALVLSVVGLTGQLVFPMLLTAQEAELRFDRISVEEGLSHSSVWAIHQDSQGFLWFGTQEGLNRYDGYHFKVYKNEPENSESLSASPVFAIYEDRNEGLWIGTRGGGLNRFDRAKDRFEHFRHDPAEPGSLSHDIVVVILEDRSGELWVGTGDGLNRLDRKDKRFARFRQDPTRPGSLSGNLILAIHQDRAGNLWVGTDKGLNRYDPGTESFRHYKHDPDDPHSLSHDRIRAIQEDAEGNLWVGTANGLNRFDHQSATFDRFLHDPTNPQSLSHNEIRSLHLDLGGELWIGTQAGGLNRFKVDPTNRLTTSFFHHRHDPLDPETVSGDSIMAIYQDQTGVDWFGTYAGVSKYDRRRDQFTTFRNRPGQESTLSGRAVWAIHEDEAGVLWVGTYDGGLNRLDRKSGEIAHYKPGPDFGNLPDSRVSAICEDRSGTLWVGTFAGLGKLNPPGARSTRGQFFNFQHDPSDPRSLSHNVVLSLFSDSTDRLWVGTVQGLNRLDRAPSEVGSEGFIRYPVNSADPTSLANERVRAIYEDRSGALWFGTTDGGLYRLDPGSESFSHYLNDPTRRTSLSSNSIASIYEDRMGTLWIGTNSAGLNRLDRDQEHPFPEHFVRYREKDGLASDTVLGILEGGDGNLWLSTSRGLSKFDPRSETFRNYSVDDGLQSNIFANGAFHQSRTGEMFFGGTHGFNAFFPDQIKDDPHVPPIVITDFLLFNAPVSLQQLDPGSPLERSILKTRELTLSDQHYVFSFEFAALNYAKPRKNQYAYRLEGFDRDWVYTTSKRRTAQYSNLEPGEYVFRVKGSNGDGVWNEEGASIRLVLLPPPWRTWWAYLTYVLALSAVILTYVHLQKKRIADERENATRERTINRQLREVDRERKKLITKLEERNAELASFTYTVSHDLKSPLVTIKGFLGLLRKDVAAGNSKRLEHDIFRIGAAADKMQNLLEDLLELSRVGRQMNPPEPVPMSEVALEAIELVAGQIAERGVDIEIEPDLSVVFGDRVRLLEVLQNLIDNAVKYLGDQGDPRIEIGIRQDGQEVVYYVMDNGMGIEAKYHEKVFGLFERLSPEGEGTGIGLTLVKRIVETHGGKIWIESEGLGRGSTFCFTVPGVKRG